MNAPSPRTSSWKKPTQRVLAIAIAGFVTLLACSRQGEGDRCSTENDDNDCESGLICIDADDLRANDGVPRCCRPDGEGVGDGRCTRLIGGGSGGTDGGGNAGGQAGEAGVATSTTGASCTHTSQCPGGMVCGPQGRCQPECLDDRDCDASLTCSEGRCVSR
ncbi:MAG TPA: hypothetical protein VI197_20475 [Polyangiaceae bacterium]